jgi:hypothetical protein
MPTKRSSFSLDSPNRIRVPCDPAEIERWFDDETLALEDQLVRQVVCQLARNLDAFVIFPKCAVLLWQGCDRIAPAGKKQKHHAYPALIKDEAGKLQIPLDTRPNGPAVASFLFAGGKRPMRFGSTNAWNIRRLYSGKFPYIGRTDSLNGQRDGKHFTQSAGLVAAHPLADALVDEFPAFSWLLRARAYQMFGYDPDHVFTDGEIDGFGFAPGRSTEIVFKGEVANTQTTSALPPPNPPARS